MTHMAKISSIAATNHSRATPALHMSLSNDPWSLMLSAGVATGAEPTAKAEDALARARQILATMSSRRGSGATTAPSMQSQASLMRTATADATARPGSLRPQLSLQYSGAASKALVPAGASPTPYRPTGACWFHCVSSAAAQHSRVSQELD